MASVARQPFAVLDGARLQSLASTKNRQNAASSSPKRKVANDFDIFDDAENQKPLPSKRAKNSAMASPKDAALCAITANAAAAPRKLHKPATSSLLATCTPAPLTPPKKSSSRAVLKPKSPAARLAGVLKTAAAAPVPKPAALTVPAGRSPPRAKRTTMLKQQARGIAQPALGRSSAAKSEGTAPFSLDAALKGTFSSAKSRQAGSQAKASLSSIFSSAPGGRSSATPIAFDIYEDTPEQEMTNMLQHSTCVLDISSDEESENKDLMNKADGVDKENVPPEDDASQLSVSRPASPARRSADEMELIKERRALVDLVAEDFYADGVDSTSVFIVPADEDDVKGGAAEAEADKFELWESTSAHGDDEAETDVE